MPHLVLMDRILLLLLLLLFFYSFFSLEFILLLVSIYSVGAVRLLFFFEKILTT